MSLIGWWKLNGDALDSSISANHGTNTGVAFDPSYGLVCQGGSFAGGRTSYITFNTINITTHHTVCLWMYGNVQTPGSATGSTLFGEFNTVNNYSYAADGLRFRIQDGTGLKTWDTDTDFYHKWRYVVLLFNDSTIELFFDGVSQGTQSYDGTFILNCIAAAYTDDFDFDYNC